MGEPPVSVYNARFGGPGDHRPWRALRASRRACARKGHHERHEAGVVSGSERHAQRPERGRGSSPRCILPMKVGNHDPWDPREGRHRRVSRCAGRTDGRDAGLTNRIHATPAHCTTGPCRARVSTVMRHTGCRLCGALRAHARGDRGTGCVHCARTGLWGGRRVTGAFTRKLTAYSLRSCLAVRRNSSYCIPNYRARIWRRFLRSAA